MFRGEFFQHFHLPKKDESARLESELRRQAGIYEALGVNEADIMKLLTPKPEGLTKEFVPVVVLGTSVDFKRQAELAGIDINYDISRATDIAGGITFDTPHLIWVHDGSDNLGKSVEWVRSHLDTNVRPATQYDVVALAIVSPNFRKQLQKHVINVPGTSLGLNLAPYVHDWMDGPGMGYRHTGLVDPHYGSATCTG